MLRQFPVRMKLFAVSVVFRAVSLLKAKEDEANVAKIKAHRKKSEKFQTISCIVREMTDDEAFEAMITRIFKEKMLIPSKKLLPLRSWLRKDGLWKILLLNLESLLVLSLTV